MSGWNTCQVSNAALLNLPQISPDAYLRVCQCVYYDTVAQPGCTYGTTKYMRALLSKVGDAKVYQVKVSKQPFFRVRLGPASSVDEADKMLARIVASGYADARIIVD